MIPAIVAGVASLAGAYMASRQSRRDSQDARDYNANATALSNKERIAQWNRENRYNSPEGLRSRGLNPDLYADSNGSLSANSPELSSQPPAVPNSGGSPSGRALESLANAAALRLSAAQARNLEAEASGKEIDNQTRGVSNEADIAEKNVRIENISSDTAVNEQQISLLKTQAAAVSQSIEESRVRLKGMSQDQVIQRARLVMDNAKLNAELKALASKSNLDDATARKINAELPYIISSMIASTDYNTASTRGIRINNGLLSLDFSAARFALPGRFSEISQNNLRVRPTGATEYTLNAIGAAAALLAPAAGGFVGARLGTPGRSSFGRAPRGYIDFTAR